MLLYASLTDLQSTLQEFTEVNQSVSLVKFSPSSVLADHCKFKILVWKRCKYCLQCHNTHKNTSVWKLNSPYLVCHSIFVIDWNPLWEQAAVLLNILLQNTLNAKPLSALQYSSHRATNFALPSFIIGISTNRNCKVWNDYSKYWSQ